VRSGRRTNAWLYDFIRRMIFPGGGLPAVASLAVSPVRATDLRVIDPEDIGRNYAETLKRWAKTSKAGRCPAPRRERRFPPALGSAPRLL